MDESNVIHLRNAKRPSANSDQPWQAENHRKRRALLRAVRKAKNFIVKEDVVRPAQAIDRLIRQDLRSKGKTADDLKRALGESRKRLHTERLRLNYKKAPD